jgi:hypothetical protein
MTPFTGDKQIATVTFLINHCKYPRAYRFFIYRLNYSHTKCTFKRFLWFLRFKCSAFMVTHEEYIAVHF